MCTCRLVGVGRRGQRFVGLACNKSELDPSVCKTSKGSTKGWAAEEKKKREGEKRSSPLRGAAEMRLHHRGADVCDILRPPRPSPLHSLSARLIPLLRHTARALPPNKPLASLMSAVPNARRRCIKTRAEVLDAA